MLRKLKRLWPMTGSASFCALLFFLVLVMFNIFIALGLHFKGFTSRSTTDSLRENLSQRGMSEADLESQTSQYVGSTGNLLSKNRSSYKAKNMITVEEFWDGSKTGNTLIDDYGKNSSQLAGDMGRGVVITVSEKSKLDNSMKNYHVNTLASDIIPLNRMVPDSRIDGCDKLEYSTELPAVSIIIPFYNEWPSLLLRSVYSVINRTPRKLVKEIILVNDNSTLEVLGKPLEDYINTHFPKGLVRLLKMPSRHGLIAARMRGCSEATGEVLVFFDSHMEVNINWLPPLLTEIVKDRKTVAMSTLDYIQADTFEYRYNVNYLTRYGFNWKLVFFETFFRQDQVGSNQTNPRPGAAMVGAAFAMDKKYFEELGGYDVNMTVWGGENLEMSWRVWLCGGRLIHVPCSRIGHVARTQPYSFPGGRGKIEKYNYKRAAAVWMGEYSRFLYQLYPDMKDLDVGDLSQRHDIKTRLGCKDFKWYLQNVWPELNVYDENVTHWGGVQNQALTVCLDNAGYLFQAVANLYFQPCAQDINTQGFSLTTDGLLRTTLQCVVAKDQTAVDGGEVGLEDCIIGKKDKWTYTSDHCLLHQNFQMCLDIGPAGPILHKCDLTKSTQKWTFQKIAL